MKRLIAFPASRTFLPSILSGLLFGLSYPAYPYVRLEVLAWVWMVPLLLALKQVQSLPRFLCRVYLATFVACVFGMSWLMTSTVPGTLLLFFVGAAVLTVPFVGLYFVRRSLGWRAALWSAPVMWTAGEWLYHQSEGSFGWLAMGVTQSNMTWLVQYVDLTGVWGITFWLVLFNVLLVRAIEDWQILKGHIEAGQVAKRFLIRRLAFTCAGMILFPLAYSAYVFAKGADAQSPDAGEVSILLVQPNVDPWQRMDDRATAKTLTKTVLLTNSALGETKPDLIIWPEGAVPYFFNYEKSVKDSVSRMVSNWDTPLLTGIKDARIENNASDGSTPLSPGDKGAEIFNAALLVAPQPKQPGQRVNVRYSDIYHKRVLMPFVEHVPFVESLPFLSHLATDLGTGQNLSSGSQATVFSFTGTRGQSVTIAPAICYEQLYPAKMAEFVRNGAEMLAVISNEGWFSNSHGQYQLAAFSKLRAIETRRTIARSANTGLTCFIDPMGRIYDEAPWWSPQTVTGKARLSKQMSLYVLYTDAFPKTCAWLSLAVILAGVLKMAWQQTGWLKPAAGEAAY